MSKKVCFTLRSLMMGNLFPVKVSSLSIIWCKWQSNLPNNHLLLRLLTLTNMLRIYLQKINSNLWVWWWIIKNTLVWLISLTLIRLKKCLSFSQSLKVKTMWIKTGLKTLYTSKTYSRTLTHKHWRNDW